MADEAEGAPALKGSTVAPALGCTTRTVEKTREACFVAGAETATARKVRTSPPRESARRARGSRTCQARL